tara:strand:+ start:69802 stop:70059 length:258 start_codon:yes stop_codon:yes gene_type:complete
MTANNARCTLQTFVNMVNDWFKTRPKDYLCTINQCNDFEKLEHEMKVSEAIIAVTNDNPNDPLLAQVEETKTHMKRSFGIGGAIC